MAVIATVVMDIHILHLDTTSQVLPTQTCYLCLHCAQRERERERVSYIHMM